MCVCGGGGGGLLGCPDGVETFQALRGALHTSCHISWDLRHGDVTDDTVTHCSSLSLIATPLPPPYRALVESCPTRPHSGNPVVDPTGHIHVRSQTLLMVQNK